MTNWKPTFLAVVFVCGCAAKTDPAPFEVGTTGGAGGATDVAGSESSGNASAAGTDSPACAGFGEDCDGVGCCAPLSCLAGRICGAEEPMGTSAGPTSGSGGEAEATGSDDGGGSGTGPGVCANEFSACEDATCCPGLECTAGDLGSTCVDPMAGGDGPATGGGDGPGTGGQGDG